MHRLPSRRAVLAAAGAVPLAAAAPRAFAQGAMPGVALPAAGPAIAVGALTVTPLLDGLFPIQLAMLPDADNAEGRRLLEAAGRAPGGPTPEPVRAFAVRRGERVWLVDAGTGAIFGDGLGRVPMALEAAGIDAAKVEAVFATHLHADHVGGLALPGGGARFPNAELVVHEREVAYWTDAANRARAGDGGAVFFDAAAAALRAHEGRTRRIAGGGALAPGLTAVPLPGHTPGHYGVLVEDGGERLLIWGDVVHSATLQFPNPAWTIVFDVDKAEAAATRVRVLDMVAADRTRVTGMHMAGVGTVERRGAGYALIG